MGQVHAAPERAPAKRLYPETTPDRHNDPTFPPQYGFEEKGQKRAERKLLLTKEEMQSGKVDLKYRDFCVHKYIEFTACARSVAPFSYLCKPERDEWEECSINDYIIGMKEYERERRLLVRNARKNRLVKLKEERLAELEKRGDHHDA